MFFSVDLPVSNLPIKTSFAASFLSVYAFSGNLKPRKGRTESGFIPLIHRFCLMKIFDLYFHSGLWQLVNLIVIQIVICTLYIDSFGQC